MSSPPLNFCSNCGTRLTLRVPPGDSLPRAVCDACGTIHYRNPLMVVGTIPEWDDQILLCRRAIEPRQGFWTLPAGFMELGETTAQAALRETMEEARARVELGELFTLLSVPHVDQVHVFYRARLRERDIPWKEIAFRTISTTLRHFYADRKAGAMGFHAGELLPLK